ncbi:hypothetical protein BGZ58_002188 [Dissophora ornata]|nr:hypothetical protein BGZ58_002188 [Dissophora ornata]
MTICEGKLPVLMAICEEKFQVLMIFCEGKFPVLKTLSEGEFPVLMTICEGKFSVLKTSQVKSLLSIASLGYQLGTLKVRDGPTTRPSHRPALSPDFPTIRRRVLIDTLFDIVGAVTVQKEEVVTVQEASALGPDFPTTHRVPLGTHFDIEEAVTVQKASALNPDFPTIHRVPLGTPFDTEEVVTVQKASALTPLNQLEIWMVGDVDMLSKFNNFKHQQPQSRFSLALDGIADVSPGSEFSQTLSQEERALANVISVKDLDEKWPSLSSILSRVCAASRSYDDVVKALRKENTNEPIVDYLRDITYRYSHYLKFSDQVPRNINEREGFGDLTWPFIRGALTLANIPSRCFEIPVAGTKERKNFGRDLLVQTEEQALMADGVALFRDHQIYLAEASLIYEPKLDKEVKDKFKVVRCMRDSWNSQIKSITREAVPPLGLTVFGSTSFGDETKFYAMDFVGTYRLKQVGRMLVPLDKAHFASRMEICVRNCLRFALELQEEVERRTHLVSTSQDLTAACDTIMQTRTTPTKEVKKRRMSGHTTTAPSDPTED